MFYSIFEKYNNIGHCKYDASLLLIIENPSLKSSTCLFDHITFFNQRAKEVYYISSTY